MNEREAEAERTQIRDWLGAFDEVVQTGGRGAARRLMDNLRRRAAVHGIAAPKAASTPYLNTIPADQHPSFDGDLELERRIEAIVRWNAMAMVARAARRTEGIGGHISTYASAATLFEVGFNHVFRGPDHAEGPDLVFFQGHASPGVYARAHLEGRLSSRQLDGFRRECGASPGLSSYPHPWLMPDFWEVPSVSMGLAAIVAIYAARFGAYLHARELVEKPGRVWALLGDGEWTSPSPSARCRWRSDSAWEIWVSSSAAICSDSTARFDPTLGSSTSSNACSRARAGRSSRCCGERRGVPWSMPTKTVV